MDAHFFPFNWIVDETEEKPPLLSAGFYGAAHADGFRLLLFR